MPKGWWKNIWKFWKFLFLTFFKVGFSRWPQLKKLTHLKSKILGIFINHMGRVDVWQNLGFANFGCHLWFFSSKFFGSWFLTKSGFPTISMWRPNFFKNHFWYVFVSRSNDIIVSKAKNQFWKNFISSRNPEIRFHSSRISSILQNFTKQVPNFCQISFSSLGRFKIQNFNFKCPNSKLEIFYY